ncbi:hypothetical protein [Vibrio sp. VPAP30]|uniref:hypothetical protein n=1 Tax=Vibrio sp. VPAP30 TaxID=1647102 RepID=UPI000658ADE4|nr:hypothetical protein [Vibrio sp. VPAP30]KLN63406.1 hypothetical protein ZX61_17885 [Vibrio sp. VPAP30]
MINDDRIIADLTELEAFLVAVESGVLGLSNAAGVVLATLSIKFEVRHLLQMRMNILRWCPIPKSFAWARI